MKINLLAFGIAKEILGSTESDYPISGEVSIQELKEQLTSKFPAFEKLAKFQIAVNQEYRADDFVLSANDEVAIIPPVSGG